MDEEPGAGVGVGPDAVGELAPPPPQPVTTATAASVMHATSNLVTLDNECLNVFFILYLSCKGTKLIEDFELSQSTV